LKLMPDYHYALGYLAKVRLAENRSADAVMLLHRLCDVAPHAENLYALAEALHRVGSPEARTVYADFEQRALAESETADNANRELIFFYADRQSLGVEAKRIAALERVARHDIHTLDANAWALSAAGDHAKARVEVEKALAVGTRDATILYHAGVIAMRLQDRASAHAYLGQSLAVNPLSPVADEARRALNRLTAQARQ